MCIGFHYVQCPLFVPFQTHNSSLFRTMGSFELLQQSSFNLIFYSSLDSKVGGESLPHCICPLMSSACSFDRSARHLLPWPAHICILMLISCWDVNFRPSVIDGFHTSAETPPLFLHPADCWYISVVWGSFSQPLFFYGGIIID